MEVGIQGVEGSFHNEAASAYFVDQEVAIQPFHDFRSLAKSIQAKAMDYGVMAIENTAQYKGLYHVLGGIISPMDGIGPSDIRIEELVARVSSGEVKEVIMALSTTMEGDTTNFYIFKRLKEFDVSVSAIARGVSIGDELEYTDELTLGRSLLNRVPYENTLAR